MREKPVREQGSSSSEPVVSVQTPEPASTNYTPQAGDVVEFEYCDYPTLTGIYHDGNVLAMWLGEVGTFDKKMAANLRWTGYRCGSINEDTSLIEAHKAMRAYFAKESESECDIESDVRYKVGDLVEVVSVSYSASLDIGSTVCFLSSWYEDGVTKIEVRRKDGCPQTIIITDIRPLQGTYAERQAKWVDFHGLKVGDKVKVNEYDDADGSDAGEWDHNGGKENQCGKTYNIDRIDTGRIVVKYNWFPYSALEPVK